MPQFYPLKIKDIKRSTPESVVLSLEPETDDIARFSYKHGQYLTFRKRFDGEEFRRSYSICSSLDDHSLRVGIKKVDGGGFSVWANEMAQEGDVLEAMSPLGNFTYPPVESAAHHYLGIAAGSGITPILSLMKTLLEREPNSSFSLLYGNRSISSIMFRDEIEDLKNIYMDRLSVHYVLSTGSDLDLFSGRIDAEKCERFFTSLYDVDSLDRAFICGPEQMIFMLRDILIEKGMPSDHIQFELFGAPQQGRLKQARETSTVDTSKEICAAEIIIDGVAHRINIKGRETSVLDAALEAHLDAPYACKAGVCSTCRARVVEGEYEFVTNYALEDYEVEQGFVLSCQCFPKGERLVIDYDH